MNMLDIIEKVDATHQSFTLVFLCVLSRTRRFQTYGEKQDVVIRLNDNADIFSFRLLNPSRGAAQVNQCFNKAPPAFNSSLQVTAWSVSGALLCWQASECAVPLVQPASASDNEERTKARCIACQ